jgi:hypothetical protein
VTTFVGSGTSSLVDGVGTIAGFGHPSGITMDLNQNIIVADTDNCAIRRIGEC